MILAAGMGKRLGALTDKQTKCMVKLHGSTLLERSLDALVGAGVANIVLVVGYMSAGVRELIGDAYSNVPVTYVENPDYKTTNNVYSLYLARNELGKDDTLLLESDVVYESKILDQLLANPSPNVVVVDRLRSWMDGTVVTISTDNAIQQFVPKRYIDSAAFDQYYKTVNIYKFSGEYLRDSYIPFLEAYVRSVGPNEYYEEVLRVLASLDKQDLAAMPLSGEKWCEIDDQQDYQIAQTLFAPPELQYDTYVNRHGGYWRFPKVRDFCYLVNPYFPPAEMQDEMRRFFDSLVRDYPSSATVQSLLAALVFGTDASTMAVGNGASELICALGQEIKAARIGVSVPTFEEYLKRFPGAEVVKYSSHDQDLKPNLLQMKEVAADTDALVLVNPDNPSGQSLSTADLLELARYMEQHAKRLILDESFVDFAEPEHCTSLLRRDMLDTYPHMVLVRSISKSYGVPGIRLGVLASADTELIGRINSHSPVWNVNSFAEYFLQIVGKYQDAYQAACRQIRAERARFQRLLSDVPNIRVLPSQANYVLCEAESISATDLAQQMLMDHAILVKDCSNKVGMMNRQFLRVTVQATADNDYFLVALNSIMTGISTSRGHRQYR